MTTNTVATRTSRLAAIEQSWDDSARQGDRVVAVHLTENGKPLDPAVYDELFRYIDGHLSFGPSDEVLEVGAGSGLLLERIAARVRRAMGTDISAEQLRLVPALDNVEVRRMDSDRLELADASFDKVVCKGVFQYFPDREYAVQCLSEMVRVTRPGGRILLGDLFNAYLQDVFLGIGAQPTVNLSHILQRRWRVFVHNPPPPYLFVGPDEVVDWASELGCRRAVPVLQTSPASPRLFRMFRFDVVIER
ncbi:MAG TPA: methyltransferase domain-containing protein [Planctomycetaceae bacterium]|nr:methyltransferase domain-containing protein [Planctomycetaceae bacterium]